MKTMQNTYYARTWRARIRVLERSSRQNQHFSIGKQFFLRRFLPARASLLKRSKTRCFCYFNTPKPGKTHRFSKLASGRPCKTRVMHGFGVPERGLWRGHRAGTFVKTAFFPLVSSFSAPGFDQEGRSAENVFPLSLICERCEGIGRGKGGGKGEKFEISPHVVQVP